MVCMGLPAARSVVSLKEMAEWRAKCGFQSRVQDIQRDLKRLRQEEQEQDAPCFIDTGLYLGSKVTEADKDALKQLGVTHILQVGEELQPSNPDDFVYQTLLVYDLPQEDLVVEFPKCFEFIEAALANGGSVLVHCAAGVSRSACVAIGYLMCRKQMSFREAREVVCDARPVVSPNSGFILQLRQFELLGCDASKWGGWNSLRLSELKSKERRPLRTMSAPAIASSG